MNNRRQIAARRIFAKCNKSAFSVVMMSGVGVSRRLHGAVHVVLFTALDLDLDSRVTDSEMMIQLFLHGPQDLFTASDALFRHHNVATTTNHSGANRPNVEIMHSEDAMNIADGAFDSSHAEACWYSFQEHGNAFF